MVSARPRNLPAMNAARLTGLENRTNTVRFSTSLWMSPAAMKAATTSPKNVTATRPKSFMTRASSPRLMLPSQRLPTIIRSAKRTMTASTRSRIVSLNVLSAMAPVCLTTPSPPSA